MILSEADYKKVLKYGAADLTPPDREALASFRVIFADNLVGRSQMTWAHDALKSIASRLPGCPFTVDHDWEEVSKTIGVIYDATVLGLPSAPDKFIDTHAADINREIIKKDGYKPVIGKVAIYDGDEALAMLSIGGGTKVSIGGFRVTDLWCPICDTSFFDEACPHVPPSPWYEDDEDTAPYAIRVDTTDMGETSLVLIPNAPGAGVVTNDIAEFFRSYL